MILADFISSNKSTSMISRVQLMLAMACTMFMAMSSNVQVEVRHSVDNIGNVWINGEYFPQSSDFLGSFSAIKTVDDSLDTLIVLRAEDQGGAGGMAASVHINGAPVAWTGDNSGWKASYNLNINSPSSIGWNTSLTYNSTSWTNITSASTCTSNAAWSGINYVNALGASAQYTWGPTVS